jgi:hypothetical protein
MFSSCYSTKRIAKGNIIHKRKKYKITQQSLTAHRPRNSFAHHIWPQLSRSSSGSRRRRTCRTLAANAAPDVVSGTRLGRTCCYRSM